MRIQFSKVAQNIIYLANKTTKSTKNIIIIWQFRIDDTTKVQIWLNKFNWVIANIKKTIN
jgi:hypothetical protein